ncbi:alditol oxidase [Virgisporangium ochraceum]
MTAASTAGRNWAGNITFRAARRHRPSTIDELRRIVADSERIRAVGTAHSFNRIADSTGDLVSVADLPPTVEIDEAARTVTVSAAMRYGDLARRLQAAGHALHNLGSLPHISVAGAVATGTHGSGDRNGNLATAVRALRMVTAEGDLVTLRQGDDGFEGAVVALGLLGVVVDVTLAIEPAYEVRQFVFERLPWSRLVESFEEIFSDAYSTSLFTEWTGPVVDQVWRKKRTDEADPPTGEWFGAVPATRALHPIRSMPADNCTAQLGEPGPWHERLPHFRLEFTPSAGDELQTEFLVPREHAVDALTAVDGIRDLVAPQLQISEIRSIAADELWLSPSYRRETIGIHFTWVPDTAAVLPVVEEVQRVLAPFAPRPHWGKIFTTGLDDVAARYERWDDFERLAAGYDPAGKLRSQYDAWQSG